MAAAKDPGLAAWLKELDGGKFKDKVGARRSLGFKKAWSKADIAKARAAIDRRFENKAATVASDAPTDAPLTTEERGWADNAKSIMDMATQIIRSNREALDLMNQGLIPLDEHMAAVAASNVSRAVIELSLILPNRTPPAPAKEKKEKKGKKDEETEEETVEIRVNPDDENPETFAARR